VLNLIRRLKERNLGVVVISHNLADVFEVADRIFVLRLGRAGGEFDAQQTTEEHVVGAITGANSEGKESKADEAEIEAEREER
jgi:D-xylose transport system ATP-binding protein